MALRSVRARDEENSHLPAGKSFFRKIDVKPRAALGSLSNNVTTSTHLPEKKSTIAPVKAVVSHREPSKAVLPKSEKYDKDSLDTEEMEVAQVATQLAMQLHINDIDSMDAENPQLCAEYAKEIYSYLHELEMKYHIPPTYMKKQPQINAKMRLILVDWLIQVHRKFNLLQETLYLTVSIIDRYLSCNVVPKDKLQLVGVTAMLIASKYEEMYAPEVRDFEYITDNTYSTRAILRMERQMLKSLDYSLGNPLCLHFLRRYSRAGQASPEIHSMGKFLMELSLPDYTMLEFHPSKIAAAALCFSIQFYGAGDWTHTLEHYSSYSKEDLMPCVSKLARLVLNMPQSKQTAVREKYTSSQFLKVAQVVELKTRLVKSLAGVL